MSFSNVTNASNYQTVFRLTEYPGGSVKYGLTVSVTSALYNYYVSQSHSLVASADFAKFITPYAVKPIADAVWNVSSDSEVFADAVLGIAQQIPYQISPEVYPVETLKINYGDCGSLSLLTASILKAGGLDVVLLEYPGLQHLNVGVNLPHKPNYARSNAYYIDYNGERYYIAESTGDNFPNGWRVGECPTELKQTNPNVISIDGYEQSAPGQVSASYKTLNPSQISISISSAFAMENSLINIAGTVSPSSAQNVSIYVSSFGGVWQVLGTVHVDSDGHFVYQWKPQGGGIYYVQASWSGNTNYAGADSQAATLYVLPFYGLIALALGMMLLVLLIVFWFMNRRANMPPASAEESQTPSEPPAQEIQQPQQPAEQPQSESSQTNEEETQTQELQTNAQETSSTESTSPPQEEEPQPAPATTTPEPNQEPESTQENPQLALPPPTTQPSTEPQPQATPSEQEPTQSSDQLQQPEQKQPEQPTENAP
jgi:hypothetical protein